MSTNSLQFERIAITGAAGQLGQELTTRLGSAAIPLTRRELDLTDESQISTRLLEANPDLVINAAAYTAVDQAEAEPDTCFAINGRAVETLARVCRQLDCPLVQISTDYVLGGETASDEAAHRTPYRDTSPPNPPNVYGRSKLAGEQAAAIWRKHMIVRTCGLYAAHSGGPQRGRNFADTMLCLSRERPSLRVVDDQWCTPTYVPHFADMLLFIVASGDYGIFHATSRGATTWCAFAKELFSQAHAEITLESITTQQFGAVAPRPAYSVLAPSRVLSHSPLGVPTWQEGITAYLEVTLATPG